MQFNSMNLFGRTAFGVAASALALAACSQKPAEETTVDAPAAPTAAAPAAETPAAPPAPLRPESASAGRVSQAHDAARRAASDDRNSKRPHQWRGVRCGSADLGVQRRAGRDLAEDRVDAIEVSLGAVTDEELTAAGVLAGVGHRKAARLVFVGVEVSLALDLVAGTAGAGPGVIRVLGEGIAALDHEIRDHAMKAGPVIELFIGQLLEVGDGAGYLGIEQFGNDGASGGFNGGCLHGSVG